MRILRTMPLGILAPIYFVFTGGVWVIVGLVATPDRSPAATLIGGVFFATVMTIFTTIFVARARRGAGGAKELEAIGQAIRTGHVPEGIDDGTWRTVVEEQDRLLRRQLWLGPVVFGLATALMVGLAFARNPYWWAFAAFFVAMLIASVVSTPRGLRRITAVRDELDRRIETSRRAASGTDDGELEDGGVPPRPRGSNTA